MRGLKLTVEELGQICYYAPLLSQLPAERVLGELTLVKRLGSVEQLEECLKNV